MYKDGRVTIRFLAVLPRKMDKLKMNGFNLSDKILYLSDKIPTFVAMLFSNRPALVMLALQGVPAARFL